MKKAIAIFSLNCLVWIVAIGTLKAQPFEGITKTKRNCKLPFGSAWAQKKGIDLPAPFGISTFYTYMSRGIDVTDVSVELADRESESISEFSSFAVKNQTYVTALRLDAWILPILNVYGLVGYAGTNAKLNADITISRPVLPLPPVELELITNTLVKGPYTGVGSSMVAGYGNWFILADANYGKTWPDKLNNTVSFTMLSLRSGLSGQMGQKNSLRGWLGAAYMDSRSTLEIKVPNESIGDILVRIEQHPVNPWTMQCGFMVGLGKKFEFMTELGSNFDDASMFVLTASYRF